VLLSRSRARLKQRAARAAGDTALYLDRRLPLVDAARATLRKAFPDHWSFLLGELALYSFVVLLVTGVWLTLFFQPGMSEVVYRGSYVPLRGVRMSEAFASTLRISFDVRGGLLIRQIHHWAALVMAASVGAHMLRVFFTGAFRRPREANWLIGLTLFLLTMLRSRMSRIASTTAGRSESGLGGPPSATERSAGPMKMPSIPSTARIDWRLSRPLRVSIIARTTSVSRAISK